MFVIVLIGFSSTHSESCFLCMDNSCIFPKQPISSMDHGKKWWWVCDNWSHCRDGTDERMGNHSNFIRKNYLVEFSIIFRIIHQYHLELKAPVISSKKRQPILFRWMRIFRKFCNKKSWIHHWIYLENCSWMQIYLPLGIAQTISSLRQNVAVILFNLCFSWSDQIFKESKILQPKGIHYYK